MRVDWVPVTTPILLCVRIFNCVRAVLLSVGLLAAFSLPAADSTTTNAPLPRTDANGNPLRRAPTGHISNYDEAKVGNYTLPDPLVLANGKPVRDAEDWFKVAPSGIAQTLRRRKFTAPSPPTRPRRPSKSSRRTPTPSVVWQFTSTSRFILARAPTHRWLICILYLPANATGPVPLLLHIVFFSNPPFPDATTNTTLRTEPCAAGFQRRRSHHEHFRARLRLRHVPLHRHPARQLRTPFSSGVDRSDAQTRPDQTRARRMGHHQRVGVGREPRAGLF